MSGYREAPNFDPYFGPSTRPATPYNWLQWIGVGLMVVAVVYDLAYLAGAFGWMRKLIADPLPGILLLTSGSLLINARRQPATDPAPELAAARRKWTAIVVAICAVVLGIATIFAMKGY